MTINKIIFATDFSEQAEDASTHALAIAQRTGAELTVANAMTEPSIDFAVPYAVATPGFTPEQLKEYFDEGRKRIHEAAELLRASGASVSETLVQDLPTRGVTQLSQDIKADLIVMGTHGRKRVARFFLGSVAQWIASHVDCDVLAARGKAPEGGYKRILVPCDFSDYSIQALERAFELVAPGGAIDIVHYWKLPVASASYWGTLAKDLKESIRKGATTHGEKLVDKYDTDDVTTCFMQEETEVRKGISDRMSSDEYDLVVMGSHGLHGVKKLMLGSVAESVLRNTKHSVYIARMKGE
jgi:nucleotide-binding universal stress UspA family protein